MKEKIKIPKGLYKCSKCGEYKGKVQECDLNQGAGDDFALGSLKNISISRAIQSGEDVTKVVADIKKMEKDLASLRKSQQQSERVITVSCLCDGILCPKCKKTIIRKPGSNEYDPETNTVWHLSGMAGMFIARGCEECRKKENKL